MFITFVSLLVSALVSTPVIVKAVKKAKERKQKEFDLSDSNASLTKDILETESNPIPQSLLDQDRQSASPSIMDSEEAHHLVADAEAVISSHKRRNRSLVHVNWSTDVNPYHKPIGARLQSTSVQSRDPESKPQIDEVEHIRSTPSANQLFTDAQSPTSSATQHSQSPNPPQAISPQAIGKPTFSSSTTSKMNQGQAERHSSPQETESSPPKNKKYYLHKRRKHVIPVAPANTRHERLKMTIVDAPGARPSQHHFEVIQPTPKQRPDQSWRSQGQPEFSLDGEQMWRSFDPLYIDFSDFFSLDFLVSIDRTDLYKGERISPHGFDPSHDMDDLEPDQWTGEIPEWQKLLGHGSPFLYTLKLKQQKYPTHIQLTEHSTEDQIVDDIVARSM